MTLELEDRARVRAEQPVEVLHVTRSFYAEPTMSQQVGQQLGREVHVRELPLPEAVVRLRTTAYTHLAPIANRWNEAMGLEARYPAEHAAYLARCHAAGQAKATRFSSGTWPATTTASTRTCTASTCFRCSSRCCSPSSARTSRVGSS